MPLTRLARRCRSPVPRALAASVVVAIAWLVLPARSPAQRVLVAAVILAALIWLIRGWQTLPHPSRRNWLPVLGAVAVWAGADIGLRVHAAVTRTEVIVPGPATLLYPLGSVILALGLVTLVGQHREHQRAASVDAVIVGTSLGLVLWVLIAQPLWADFAFLPLGQTHVVVFALGNLALLTALLRFALTGAHPRPACRGLVSASALAGISALAVAVGYALGAGDPFHAITPLWMTALLLLAGAVNEPSAVELPHDAHDVPRARVARLHVAVLAAALLLLPVLQLRLADNRTDLLVAAGTAVLLILVIIRVWMLVRAADRARRVEAEADLATQQARQSRRFEALVQHTSDVLVVIDQHDRVTYATPSAVALLGDLPMGLTSTELGLLIHPDDRDTTMDTLRSRLADSGGRPVTLATRLSDQGRGDRHVELVAVDLRDDPAVSGVVLTLQETTQRIELERELRYLAFHDPLTGLCNRQLFQDRLDHALARARRTEERIAVLVCDLDDFKDVNDSAGHDTGDQVLRTVADRLRAATRAGDTVARLGGDEYAVLVENLEDTGRAVELAERLIAAVAEPVHTDGHTLALAMSVGITVDDGHRNGQEVLRDTDIAAHTAKADGKACWSLHRPTMTSRAQERLTLTADLTAAIAADELDVAFQPIVAIDPQRIVGLEALARWNHPTRGPIPPDEFIGLAERSGHIIGLGRLVLSRSLAALRRWLDAGADPDLHVAVNVSSQQLTYSGFVDSVDELLAQYGVAATSLVLELTESVLLEQHRAIAQVELLRARGVRLAVDDFGTGYSSLGYLRQLPVDILKIDRSFVQDIEDNSLVPAIVAMGRSLQLDIVAEGVENRAQLEALRALHCPFAQGYLFAPPTPRAGILTLLSDGLPPPTDDHALSA